MGTSPPPSEKGVLTCLLISLLTLLPPSTHLVIRNLSHIELSAQSLSKHGQSLRLNLKLLVLKYTRNKIKSFVGKGGGS